MPTKKISGKQAVLKYATKGSLIVGDGSTTTLVANSWYLIDAVKTTGSVFETGMRARNIFREEKTTPRVLAVGDNAYLLTLTEMCRVDVNLELSKGAIEATDSCDDNFIANIVDGFTSISGDFSTLIRVDKLAGMAAQLKEIIKRFVEIWNDDNAGAYVLTSQTDDELIIFIEWDERNTTALDYNQFFVFSINMTSASFGKPLKGVQTCDVSWVLGQDVIPMLYEGKIT